MTDSIDPLSGPGFDDLYTRQIAPALKTLEGERKKAMNRSILIWIGFALVVAVEVFFSPPYQLVLATVVGGGVVGYMPLHFVATKTKAHLIETLCGPMGVAFNAHPGEPAAYKRLLALNLLPRSDDQSFEDQFTGRRTASDFMFCEATFSSGSGKNRRTVFQGQVFEVAFPQRFLGTTVVLRDSGWLNRFNCPKGLEKVGLEDPHFEKIFQVFSDDQIESRAILTPVFMEQLVALETAYSANHIRCGFQDGTLMIAMEGADRFEVRNMFATLENRGRAESMASDIRAVIRLIDAFLAKARNSGST